MRFVVYSNGADPRNSPGNKDYNRRYEAAITPQDKRMNDEHLAELKQEWLLKHGRVPFKVAQNKALMMEWERQQEAKADAWAKANEPKRFLNPLLRPTNGISADKVMRRNRAGRTADISSSWVGDATLDASGRVLTIQLPPNKKNPTGKYTYGTTPEILKQFLGAKSLGKVISHLAHQRGSNITHSGITKLWDSKSQSDMSSKRNGTGRR